MTIEYHEPPQELSQETRDLHRALATLVEELEAIDWYQHRLDLVADEELRKLILHNRNEEMEHAAMALEYLRRRVPDFDERLRTYLFTEGSIVELEAEAEGGGDGESAAPRSLGIGSLRKGVSQ